jgi:hypothetical protein
MKESSATSLCHRPRIRTASLSGGTILGGGNGACSAQTKEYAG